MAKSVIKRLQEWRLDDGAWHGAEFSVFARAATLADIAGVQLVKPRVTGRQLHRMSQADSDETDSDYFRRSIWLPYLDTVIVEMKDRFGKMSQMAFLLTSVLMCYNIQMDNFKKVYAFYGKFIETDEEVLYEELLDYVEYRKKSCQPSEMKLEQTATDDESTPSSCTSMVDLLMTTPTRFVNIRKLLRIAATLPLTSCSAERCFSAMKILKSRLRSTMDDERLNGLALMYIHNETEISIKEVINNFALSKRKMDL
jgi:hypothetical protein